MLIAQYWKLIFFKGYLDGYTIAFHRHQGCCRASCKSITWLPGCRKGKKEAKKNFKQHFFTYTSDNSNATSCKHLLDHFSLEALIGSLSFNSLYIYIYIYIFFITDSRTYLLILSMAFSEFSILKLDQPINIATLFRCNSL